MITLGLDCKCVYDFLVIFFFLILLIIIYYYQEIKKRFNYNKVKKINPKSLTLSLVSFKKFKENSLIDNNFLIQEGFLKKKDHKKSIKLIDSIQFKKKLQFKNFKVTPGAKKRIEELGGSTS